MNNFWNQVSSMTKDNSIILLYACFASSLEAKRSQKIIKEYIDNFQETHI